VKKKQSLVERNAHAIRVMLLLSALPWLLLFVWLFA
jgi:hypothetical protein